VLVNGECDEEGGIRIPRQGGTASFYTSFSVVFLLIGVLSFVFFFLPVRLAVGPSAVNHPAMVCGLIPIIVGSCANSIGVFTSSKAMQATGYRLWKRKPHHTHVDDEDVTISSSLLQTILRGDFMYHVLPMLGSLIMLGGLIGLTDMTATHKLTAMGVATAWILAVMAVYAVTPVSSETDGVAGHTQAAEEKALAFARRRMGDADADVLGTNKFDVVYNHSKPWMAIGVAFATSLLSVVGIGALL
jgi:hypothetical protein